MRTWGVGINDYHRKASYWLDDTPWYALLAQGVAGFVCDCLHRTPVLNWGDWCPAVLWHIWVHERVMRFADRRTESWQMKIEYDEALKRHPELQEVIDWLKEPEEDTLAVVEA